jgi:uncharacterized protein YuzE
MSMDGHYDRAVDIVWLRLRGWDKDHVRVEQTASGLVERDDRTGRVVGLEYWNASERLPAELLEALPAPPPQQVVIQHQRA